MSTFDKELAKKERSHKQDHLDRYNNKSEFANKVKESITLTEVKKADI